VLQAIARKPQVMVKITGFGATGAGTGKGKTKPLLPHLDYIARQGALPVYDPDGRDIRELAPPLGEAPRALLHSFGRAIAAECSGQGIRSGRPRSRSTMHLMLSMPPGTETGGFELGVRDFLAQQFGEHEYLYVFHHDTAHPHAHVVVALAGRDGSWLNPRREDLRAWRDGFAQALEGRGVPASAIPTYSRGRPRAGYRRDLHELERRGGATRRTPSRYDPQAERRAIRRRGAAWGRIADDFARQGDAEAARAIRGFVDASFGTQPGRRAGAGRSTDDERDR
jgi:hypothetical protein